ncbi:hypothetical protein [Ruegeria sp. HKCCD8929]|uniref:hypothetical protein n=1 Tax=Ruegeria sp. HKCCD8929 TaxID=2683006 RepID=UPI001489D46F|nr:hypothetical protein [Ruegeria sp. HKCCD8929]
MGILRLFVALSAVYHTLNNLNGEIPTNTHIISVKNTHDIGIYHLVGCTVGVQMTFRSILKKQLRSKKNRESNPSEAAGSDSKSVEEEKRPVRRKRVTMAEISWLLKEELTGRGDVVPFHIACQALKGGQSNCSAAL